VSSLYQTEPVGVEKQEDYLNCAVKIETEFDPHSLLEYTKSIEVRWGGDRAHISSRDR
jgi:2-amino-4-hydroxy-6-hydroxymethyldihydropteridine diphosphokinase